MAFIQVQLKVIEVHVPGIARQTGLDPFWVLGGLTTLWHRCWSTESDVLSLAEITQVFGADKIALILPALEVEFLEKSDELWRVRGADRYLKIKASRRKGAEITNAARWNRVSDRGATAERQVSDGSAVAPATAPAISILNKRESIAPATAQATAQSSLPIALTPNTEHRAPNTKETKQRDVELVRPRGLEKEIFDFWKKTCGHPKSKFDRKRLKVIRERLADGFSADDLKAAIWGCSKTPHNQGANNRGLKYDSLGLILRDADNVERFGKNVNWPPPEANPIQAELNTIHEVAQ